jgi:HEAT repeat protein
MSTARFVGALVLCANVAAGAQSDSRCSADAEDLRLSALGSIAQMEPDQIMPVLQKILERRDECSITLRRRVVEMVARSRDPQKVDVLLRVARGDASDVIRRQAVQSLSQVNSDRTAAALDSIFANSTSIEMQDAALQGLSRQTSPSGRVTLRRVAESSTLPIEVRGRAVSYLGSGRRTTDDQSYLMALFGKTTSPELRESIMRAAANPRTPETTQWLLGIARDKNQEIELRRSAVRTVGQSIPSAESLRSSTSGLELKDLLALYDEFKGQPEMQAQLLDVYTQRSEVAATDKILQIASAEPNIDLRRRAVSRLGQRRDPRVTQFLIDIVNK